MPKTSRNNITKSLISIMPGPGTCAALFRYALSLLAILAILGAGIFEHSNLGVTLLHAKDLPQTQPVLPSFSGLVERVAPAVVSIRVKADAAAIAASDDGEEGGEPSGKALPFEPSDHLFQPPLRRHRAPGPARGATQSPPVQGQGSGFFISSDGYIVTNHHVVEGAIKVEIVTESGEILQARIAGTDPSTDLALLKADGSKAFPFVPLAHSEVKPGDWVIALGNPFGLGGTVTAGIVSGRGRDIGMSAYDNFIQIDAPVNKGNSGGPAFNQQGEVIGVNTAIFSPSGGSVGIAFAIPAMTVENVVPQLKAKGRVRRGWLGVQVQTVTAELADSLGLSEAKGALVSVPSQGSPAETAGINRGDVILKIAGEDVKDSRDLARKISVIAPGSAAQLVVVRGGKHETFEVRVAELKDETNPEPSGGADAKETGIELLGVNAVRARDTKNGLPPGLAVLDINPNGKGADAGLVQGDVILNANGIDIASPEDLEAALRSAKAAGKKHALTFIQRGDTQVFLALPADLS